MDKLRRARQREPQFIHLFAGVVIQRRQPQVRLRQGTQPIIDAGIDVHNIAMLLDGVDRR